MKLLSSLKKEMILASRGYYFYVEIFMTLLILVFFLFIIPENFNKHVDEYIYLDLPKEIKEAYLNQLLQYDVDQKVEKVVIKIEKEKKKVDLYQTDHSNIHIMNSYEDMKYMGEKKSKPAAKIYLDKKNELAYEHFLQGYESGRFKNIIKVIHMESSETLEENMDALVVKPQFEDMKLLSDKENILPPVLVFNSSLMGMFLIAAYIFLDKEEGVMKALAVTPDPVWHYLLSKILFMTIISIILNVVIILPIKGFQINYILFVLLLTSSGFFSSVLGLFLASFYEDVRQAFGSIYVLMMVMMIPTISYMMPSWNPKFVKYIPSDAMLQGFKSILLGEHNILYILGISGFFLLAGLILFFISNFRYKKFLN